MIISTFLLFNPRIALLFWPHCPSHFGVFCTPFLSLGFPCKHPDSPWVLTAFPGIRSHPPLCAFHCCSCSGLCASFHMDPQPPCTLQKVLSSSPAFICSSPLQTLIDPRSLSGGVYRASCYLDGFMKFCLWRDRVSELQGALVRGFIYKKLRPRDLTLICSETYS